MKSKALLLQLLEWWELGLSYLWNHMIDAFPSSSMPAANCIKKEKSTQAFVL